MQPWSKSQASKVIFVDEWISRFRILCVDKKIYIDKELVIQS